MRDNQGRPGWDFEPLARAADLETETESETGSPVVLYVDADATTREATRRTIHDRREALTIADVGSVAGALEIGDGMTTDCLVVDPEGLEGAVTDLAGQHDCPVVLYTALDPSDVDAALLDLAESVVEKGAADTPGAFLAEKIVGLTADTRPRSAVAVTDALADVASEARRGEVTALVDANGGVQWASDALGDVLPGSPPDAPADDGPNVYDWLDAVAEQSADGESLVARLRRDGTDPVTVRATAGTDSRWLLAKATLLPSDVGAQTLLELRDVTTRIRRAAHEALRGQLAELAQDGLYTLDSNGRIDYCNRSFAEMLGYEPPDLRGEHASAVLASGELAKGQATVQDLLEDPASTHTTVDLTFLRRDGTERDLSINYTVIESPDGTYQGLMGVARDVTERRERERTLGIYKELFDGLVSNFPSGGVFLFDRDLRFTEAGGLDLERLGLEPADFVGNTPSQVFPPENAEKLEAAYRTALDGEASRFEDSFGGFDYTVQTIPIRETDGEVVAGMAVAINVTDERERQQELERQRDELATLTRIQGLIQDVIRALGSAATRGEIEAQVCQRLVESPFYERACIGERDVVDGDLVWRTGALAGGDSAAVDWAEAVAGVDGLAAQAVETGEGQVQHDVADNERPAGLDGTTPKEGVKSVAAVPLRTDTTVHGALVVFANQDGAFRGRAVDAFAVLGEMVGLALTAVQNRQLLLDDRVVELEFEAAGESTWLGTVAREHGCRLAHCGSVDLTDASLTYLQVGGAAPEAVLASCLATDPVEGGRVVRAEDDSGVLELCVTRALEPLLLDVGACPVAIVADGGGLELTVELPLDVDVRSVHKTLANAIDGITLTAKQERPRTPETAPDAPVGLDALTDRQEEILRAAYFAGYYGWPRDTTAEELADSLDISSPTLHQHLRRATRNLLESLLEN